MIPDHASRGIRGLRPRLLREWAVHLSHGAGVGLEPLPEEPPGVLALSLPHQLHDLTPEGMLEKGATREGIIEPRGLNQGAVHRLCVRELGFGALKDTGNEIKKV